MELPLAYHTPVLLPQVRDALHVKRGGKYIDATIGGGGFTKEILELGGTVLGIDFDTDALEFVREQVQVGRIKAEFAESLFLHRGNFRDIGLIARQYGFLQVDGAIFDLGMSSWQIDRSKSGFSYLRDEPLDMRMDKRGKVTAAVIINKYCEGDLYEILANFSEELNSGAIATAIVRARTVKGGIVRTLELVKIIDNVLRIIYKNMSPEAYKSELNRCLARIFQALRIAVNDELTNLNTGISQVINILVPGGRVLVISYHSLEDRTVKFQFKSFARKGILKILTKNPILPDYQERSANTRSRGAKLRIGEKIT
jgi:16S rRNA (cytosine1402-N4)-methyltransferase